MKKLLLGLGTLAAVVAPVTAVVACGGTQHTTPPKTDGGDIDPTSGAVKGMLGIGHSSTDDNPTFFNEHKFSAFQMNGEEIASAILNTKVKGQLEISDSDISSWGMVAGTDMDTNASKKYFSNTLAKPDEAPTLEINIKKADLVNNVNILEKKNTLISSTLDLSKKYIYKVDEIKKDSDKNDGEWKLSFFEAKTPTPKLTEAIDVLKNKFEFDKTGAIAKMGGMYLYGQHHLFDESDSSHKLTSAFGGVKPKSGGGLFSLFTGGDTYMDRASKDNLVDWTGYTPKKAEDINAIKTALKGIKVDATFVLDAKTLTPKLRLNVLDTASNQLETVYIDSGDAFVFDKVKTEKDFSEVWTKNFKFSVIFGKIDKLKTSANKLLDEHVPGVGLKMFDLVNLVNTLARTNSFNQTTDFMNKFYTWLKTQPDINVDSIINGLENFNYAELDDVMSIGAKGWTGFNDAYILGQKLNMFLEAELKNNKNWKIEKVSTVADFNQKLIEEAMKPQRVKEAKAWLDAHKPAIPYAGKNDDDILALVISTKSDDYKAAVAALSSDVAAFKTTFDPMDDTLRSVGEFHHHGASEKAGALAKFVASHWDLIISDKTVDKDKIVPIFRANGIHKVKLAEYGTATTSSDYIKTLPPTALQFVKTIKQYAPSEVFDKLNAAIFKPLGLIA